LIYEEDDGPDDHNLDDDTPDCPYLTSVMFVVGVGGTKLTRTCIRDVAAGWYSHKQQNKLLGL
jgi:hypothetical protein